MLSRGFFLVCIGLWLMALLSGAPERAIAADQPRQVSVSYCIECVPFQFTNVDGQPDGLLVDFWKLWSKKTGISVNFAPATWSNTLSQVREGRADAHAGLFFSTARHAYLDYGAPLTKTDTHVFFHKDIAFPRALSELKAYRVATIAGDLVEGWLRERLGDDAVAGYPDYHSLIAALNAGEIKVFAADTPTALFHLGRSGLLSTFRHQKLKPLYTSKWFTAVGKGKRDLLQVINEGMSMIGPAERLALLRTWASGQRSDEPAGLIVAIDNDYPPLSSIGIDGAPQGLLVDLWRAWGKVTKRKVRFKAGTWQQTLDDVRTGEADIHSGLFKSADREHWMAFSQPIQNIKTGLFSKFDAIGGGTLTQLKGKQVGAVAGTYQASYLEREHPDIKLHKFPDRTSYLVALMRGEIAAIVEEVPTVSAYLARFGLSGAVTRRADLFENQVFAGVRRDNMVLLDFLNEGLNKIPLQTLAEIEARWIPNPKDRFFAVEAREVNLTKAEVAWIEAHPEINVAATPDWPPFEWQDKASGEHRGISADFIRLAAAKVGLKVKSAFGPWPQLIEKLKTKRIDVAPGLNQTTNRDKFLLFTEPFVDYFSVIFTKAGRDDIKSMDDLAGKTVVVEQGYALAETIPRDFPGLRLKIVDTSIEALQAVSSNDADAYIGNQLVGTFLITKYLLKDLKTSGFYNRIPGRFRFGIRNDWPELKRILGKGLAAITTEERSAIIRAHTGLNLDMGNQVRLSDEERDWLSKHPTIRLGVDSTWPPFEYMDGDMYSGLAAGYIEAISKRLDTEMVPKPALTWQRAIEAIESKTDQVDMLPAVAITPERKAFLNFTKPYLTFPMVIAARKDAAYIGDMKDLDGKKVGMVRNYFVHEMVRANHPEIIPVLTDTVGEGLEQLEDGKAVAFIDNLGVITYELDRLGIEQIKIAAPTKYKVELSMGVRKDWPELIPILTKALETIDEKERAAIRNTWLALRVNIGWDLKTVLTWALPIGGSAALVILVIIVWNRKLGVEISERKKAQADLTVANDKLGQAMGHIEGSINYASRIQRSVLPDEPLLKSIFNDYFIHWQPRDVVGGDIYWASKWGEGAVVCLGDCTGHGVPGAFMTLISTGAMERSMIETEVGDVGAFLQRIHQAVQSSLGQDVADGESDDGMELGVCYFTPDGGQMHFAGARFDMFMVNGDELVDIKPTRKGIGYRDIPFDQNYQTKTIDLSPGLRFYMTSDGLIDQVGGERRRAFGKKRFRKLLLSVQELSFDQQKRRIIEALDEHQGAEVRRDDIAVIGFGI